MGIEELGLHCSESGSDISFSDSLEEDVKQEINQLEEVESDRYIEVLRSDDSEAESELSFKGWLDEKNQTKCDIYHQQDVSQLDPVKGLEVDGENEVGLKPRKRMKSKTDSVDSTDDFVVFSFFGEETATTQVKDNSSEEDSSKE